MSAVLTNTKPGQSLTDIDLLKNYILEYFEVDDRIEVHKSY